MNLQTFTRRWLLALVVLTLALSSYAAANEPARTKRYPLAPIRQRTSALGLPAIEQTAPMLSPEQSLLRLPVAEETDDEVATDEVGQGYSDVAWRLPPLEELPPPVPRAAIFPSPPPAMPVPESGLAGLIATTASSQQNSYQEAELGCGAHHVPYFGEDFGGDPICYKLPYDSCGELGAYEGKQCLPAQRPWIELGRPFYDWGQFPPSSQIFGDSNLAASQFLLYGDFRTAIASNQNGGNGTNLAAARLNLEVDWKVTATERFHASFQPMNKGQNFTFLEFGSSNVDFNEEFNLDPFTGYFEGDLGALWGGLSGQVQPFDLPIAVGFMPLVFQNGVWLEDNVIGAAVSLPARNSALLDISNYDITFFTLLDNVDSPAFQDDNNAAIAFGTAGFFEMADGYLELDYAYLHDSSNFDRSYHNLAAGYTRRYFSFLSNSVRVIANVGQDTNGIAPTADGVMLLTENSLITADPYLFVPYFNTFVGFRRVQSVARNGAAGGILRNTGILFETDNLTGYPTLDPTGNETYGGALGVNLIPATIDRQLVLEYAFVGVMDRTLANARGNQHGAGVRYQKNLTNAWLFRADAMYGVRSDDTDISGARMELRYKF